MRPRTGFTLVEMLIGLVLLGLVSTTIYRMLNTQQRLARTQAEQVSLQSGVRMGSLAAASELREIGINSAGGTDIIAMSANSITYRGLRSTGLACQVAANEVRVLSSRLYGPRGIIAGQDTLLLFVDGDPNTTSDDQWLVLPITSVNNASLCGASTAVALGTTINTGTTPLSRIILEAPIRTFEEMQMGVVAQGGQNWLGVASLSAGQALQPAVGPITATGLQFVYYDATGAVTASRTAVRSIQMKVVGQTDRTVRAAGQGPLQVVQDSLSTRIWLRNAPHP